MNQPPDKHRKSCNFKLAMHLMFAFAAGMMITIIGFVLTFAYLLTSGHMHAADPSRLMIYLVAPAIGSLVTLAGAVLALRLWMKTKDQGHNGTT